MDTEVTPSVPINIYNRGTRKPGTLRNRTEQNGTENMVTRHIPAAADTQALCVCHLLSVLIG